MPPDAHLPHPVSDDRQDAVSQPQRIIQRQVESGTQHGMQCRRRKTHHPRDKHADSLSVCKKTDHAGYHQIPAQNSAVAPIEKHGSRHAAYKKKQHVKHKLQNPCRQSPACRRPGLFPLCCRHTANRAASAPPQTRCQGILTAVRAAVFRFLRRHRCRNAEQIVHRTEQKPEKQCFGERTPYAGSTGFH